MTINPEKLAYLLSLHDVIQAHMIAVATGCGLDAARAWLESEADAGRFERQNVVYHRTHPDVPIGVFDGDYPYMCPECERDIAGPEEEYVEVFYWQVGTRPHTDLPFAARTARASGDAPARGTRDATRGAREGE